LGLWKRGNVYWAYFYVDGVRRQQSTGTTNRRKAETILQRLKEEANDRRFQVVEMDPNITFGEIAARFVGSGIARPHHLYHLKILLPYFEGYPVLQITKNLAAEYRRSRMRHKKIKDATVNRDLSALRHLLYWAVDENLIAANPLARLRMERERKIRRQVISLHEEAQLLGAAPEHLRRIIIAALDTGMRRGEITHQLWEDIDLSRRLLFVTKSKTPEGEMREIPLTCRLAELLRSIEQPSGLVFTYREEAVCIIKRSWKSALRRAGVRPMRFHDLRHAFNTRLMEAGVIQEVRMALMGHSSGNSIHSVYTHVELPIKRDAIVRLQAWVKNQPSQKQIQGGNNASTENP
jgi:integrase